MMLARVNKAQSTETVVSGKPVRLNVALSITIMERQACIWTCAVMTNTDVARYDLKKARMMHRM